MGNSPDTHKGNLLVLILASKKWRTKSEEVTSYFLEWRSRRRQLQGCCGWEAAGDATAAGWLGRPHVCSTALRRGGPPQGHGQSLEQNIRFAPVTREGCSHCFLNVVETSTHSCESLTHHLHKDHIACVNPNAAWGVWSWSSSEELAYLLSYLFSYFLEPWTGRWSLY